MAGRSTFFNFFLTACAMAFSKIAGASRFAGRAALLCCLVLLCVFLVAGFVCFAEGVPDCTHSSGAVSTSIVENFEALYYSKLQEQVQPSLPASYTYSV